MDGKQLNFLQPLLTVRRFPSTLSSQKDNKRKMDLTQSKTPHIPSYKSELKSGPIRHPGTVPFVWERSPGKPKDENVPQKNVGQPLVAPKLPPARILQTTKEDSDKNPEHLSLSRRHREVLNGSLSVSTPYHNVIEQESSKNAVEVESSDSGKGDEAYIDALDTLSRTESSFINCSVSGISGLDGSVVNTSKTFSTDQQTRDFMMGRFLPAAKAMTSETHQYAPKRQALLRELPRPVIKVRRGDEKPPLRYGLNVTPHYAHEKDESDDRYDRHGQFPANVCGLLPKFCLKSSLCLLNPVPGMSVKTRVPTSPGSRTYGSFSSTGYSCENENAEQDDQLSCPWNPQKLEGSSLYWRLQGKGMSSPNNKLPQSSFSEQKEFLPVPSQAKDAGATLLDPSSHREPDHGNNMIEKTLYVDIVHKMESPSKNFYSSNKSGENDLEKHLKWKDMEAPPTNSTSLRESQNVEAEEANLQVICPKLVELSIPTVADKSNHVKNPIEFIDDLTNPKIEEFPQTGNRTSGIQQPPKADMEKSDQSQEFPVPPPLPKSPSDSWLQRALPSKSSKTPSSKSKLGMMTHRGDLTSKNSSVQASFANAQLSANFYATCPNVETIVHTVITPRVKHLPRLGANVRIFFHDCFVNGCDASIMLDDVPGFTGEKTNSLIHTEIGFELIDAIKSRVEASCNATVSCADILAIAARDSVVALGGPSWTVQLGRRDATTASPSAVITDIPIPINNLSTIISKFSAKGLNPRDMTALSGAHTIGVAQCNSFKGHIYNDTNINADIRTTRHATCPTSGGDLNEAPLDIQSPNQFDNSYYQNLVNKCGLLHSDQELFNGGSQDELTLIYSTNKGAYFRVVTAIVKMGNISPLIGTSGEIRKNCRLRN